MSKYVFIYSLQINIFEKINYFTKLKKNKEQRKWCLFSKIFANLLTDLIFPLHTLRCSRFLWAMCVQQAAPQKWIIGKSQTVFIAF